VHCADLLPAIQIDLWTCTLSKPLERAADVAAAVAAAVAVAEADTCTTTLHYHPSSNAQLQHWRRQQPGAMQPLTLVSPAAPVSCAYAAAAAAVM
jgi:hypothetical protein